MGKKKPKQSDNTIAQNRKARFEFHIIETHEAGLSLMGWEVKSLRAGRVNLSEAYIYVRDGEAWLDSAIITPLLSASTHVDTNGMRLRKLLMHRRELDQLVGQVDRKGYTLVPLSLYWSRGKVKLSVGLAKGKQTHDKRATIKERDWSREKARILKSHK